VSGVSRGASRADKWSRVLFILFFCVSLAQWSFAQATQDSALSTDEAQALAEPSTPTEARPVLPDEPYWVPIMIILVGAMFLSAAVIGPIVRLNMPEELPPPAHSHDEPPGESHHHGASGTLNPAPEAELGHHH
jgi:hypothetical protein